MRRVTASKAALLLACPVALTLPHDDIPEQYKEAIDYGHAAHKYYETGEDPFGEFGHITRPMPEPGATCYREMSFWYDPIGNTYGMAKLPPQSYDDHIPGHYIAGTADYVDVNHTTKRVRVIDLKTGKTPGKAKGNAQLLMLAGLIRDTLSLIGYAYELIIHNAPRGKTLGKSGRARLEWFDTTEDLGDTEVSNAWGLLIHAHQITLIANSGNDRTKLELAKIGRECYFCPARRHCAAYSAHVNEKYRAESTADNVDQDLGLDD